MRKTSWFLTLMLAATVINYPNPFTPATHGVTTIECSAEATANAFLYIYDLSAKQLVRKAFNQTAGATTRTTWNGYADSNQQAGSGIYLYQIITTDNQRIGKGKIWLIN